MGNIPVDLSDLAQRIGGLVDEIFPVRDSQQFLSELCSDTLVFHDT